MSTTQLSDIPSVFIPMNIVAKRLHKHKSTLHTRRKRTVGRDSHTTKAGLNDACCPLTRDVHLMSTIKRIAWNELIWIVTSVHLHCITFRTSLWASWKLNPMRSVQSRTPECLQCNFALYHHQWTKQQRVMIGVPLILGLVFFTSIARVEPVKYFLVALCVPFCYTTNQSRVVCCRGLIESVG